MVSDCKLQGTPPVGIANSKRSQIPYFFRRRQRVAGSMPNTPGSLLQRIGGRQHLRICPSSIFSRGTKSPTLTSRILGEDFIVRSSQAIISPLLSRTARSTAFRSSRTLPGQSQAISAFLASSLNLKFRRWFCRAKKLRRPSAKAGYLPGVPSKMV